MSLVREADQLGKLAGRTLQRLMMDEHDDTPDQHNQRLLLEALRMATDYVVGFNMKGLHKIEKDLFFPWVRDVTCHKAVEQGEEEICRAITDIMNQLEVDRRKLETVGASMVRIISVFRLISLYLSPH